MTTEVVNGIQRGDRAASLRKIIAYANQPKKYFVDGKYSDGKGCHCAVGVLFTPAQLRDIARRGMTQASVMILASAVGRKNIEFVTGMSLSELKELQEANDRLSGDRIRPAKTEIRMWAQTRLNSLEMGQ